jgi:hypothetical protein
MQDQRSCGLCFNCDEKFVPGHRCHKLFLIEGLYEEDDEGADSLNEFDRDTLDEPRISLHAINGSPTPRTMRVLGRMGTHQVTTLMDTGNRHNFLNSTLAERMGLQPTKGARLLVTMANGKKLSVVRNRPKTTSKGVLPALVWQLVLYVYSTQDNHLTQSLGLSLVKQWRYISKVRLTASV